MSDRAASLEATDGRNPDLLRSIKQGRSSVPRGSNIAGLAKVLQVSAEWFLVEAGEEFVESEDYTEEPTGTGDELKPSQGAAAPIPVAGKVAAGVFREVDEIDQSKPEWITEPEDPEFPQARRMAFDVEGESMNALKPRPIFPGDRVICLAYEDVADKVPLRDGMVVVVERSRDGGHTREWSLKQIEFYRDRIEFHPRSTNPNYKPIVVQHDSHADEGVSVEIIGLLRRVSNTFRF